MQIRPKIALVLGSGSARGMSHIGVIRALQELSIEPDIVVGCSVGALVGASYLNGRMDTLSEWALNLGKRDIARYFDLNLSMTGFVHTERMQEFFTRCVGAEDLLCSELSKPFASVATDLVSGEEVWLQEGKVQSMVWASMSYPGLFPAYAMQGHWMVDGGLLNPVPVSLAKAMGASFVIAVNLNAGISKKGISPSRAADQLKSENIATLADTDDESVTNSLLERAKLSLQNAKAHWLGNNKENQVTSPKVFDVVSSSINIMQERLTRSRLVGDPPDVILSPRLHEIGLLELYESQEAINEGHACVMRMRSELEYLLRDLR